MILINPTWQTCPTSITGASALIGTFSNNDEQLPHYGYYGYGWGAWILTAAEVGIAKQITAIGYTPTGYTPGFQYLNQFIKMAHVVESSWPNETPAVNLSDLTVSDLKIVKSSFTENIVNNVVNKYIFDSNFCYNGTSNLLIIWENRDGQWTGGFSGHRHTAGVNQGAYKHQDTTYPIGTGTRMNTKPQTTIYS
jgi:hypothetical protein